MLRLIGYFFGIATVLFLLVAAGVVIYIGDLTKDLPDYEVLAQYEPPVTTRVYSSDGQLMGEFARQTTAKASAWSERRPSPSRSPRTSF